LQSSAKFIGRHPRDADHLISAALTRGYSNGGARDFQKLRQKLDAGLIGAAFNGRRGEDDLESAADLAEEGVPAGARLHADGEGSAVGSVADGDHESSFQFRVSSFMLKKSTSYFAGRSPKIAVPMRTQVEPSSMATSKSCDIPMERTSMPMAGSLRPAIWSRSWRNWQK